MHPQIPNPDYKPDDSIGFYDHEYAAFEIWQVKSGTIFDHILVTDSVEEAEAFATGHFAQQHKAEKAMYDKQEEERQEKEKAEREAEKKKLEEEKGDEEDDDDEDEDDEEPGHTHDEL